MPPVSLQAGEACRTNFAPECDRARSLICSPADGDGGAGTCIRAPLSHEGEACDDVTARDPRTCAGGLTCFFAADQFPPNRVGKCRRWLPDGASCVGAAVAECTWPATCTTRTDPPTCQIADVCP